jgi:transcription initiation factor IIE alpha subunit
MDEPNYYACGKEPCPNFGAPYHDDKAADCPVCGETMVQIDRPDAFLARQLERQAE